MTSHLFLYISFILYLTLALEVSTAHLPTSASIRKRIGSIYPQGHNQSQPDRILLRDDNDPHNRGTVTINCEECPSACNNACFNVFCISKDQYPNRLYFDPNHDNYNHHLLESGCIGAKSVCRTPPMSQVLSDAINMENPTCNQWPPPFAYQPVRGSDGWKFATLRCIPGSEDQVFAAQINSFMYSKDPDQHPGRRGVGPFISGDYYDVEFTPGSLNENLEEYGFCTDPHNGCANEGGLEIYASKFEQKLDTPYNYDTMNQYNILSLYQLEGYNIVQCTMNVTRRDQSKEDAPPPYIEYEVYIMDHKGKVAGFNTSTPTNEDPLLVDGVNGQVRIVPSSSGDYDIMSDWQYEQNQTQLSFLSPRPGAGGPWCKINPVEGEEVGERSQISTCSFPCYTD